MKKVEVFISGGGIAGLTLACLLANANIRTAIIDPFFPKKAEHGTRTAAIMNSLLHLFEDIGILEEIKSFSAPLQALKIKDTASSHFKAPLEKTFYASEIEQDAFSWNIPNNLLRHSLYKAASKLEKITIIDNDQICDFEYSQSGIEIHTKQGIKMTCALLVGADGRNSFVREHSIINAELTDTMQTAITTIIEHTKPHENTSIEIHKSGGPFTLVPLPGKTSSLVWVEETKYREAIEKLKKDEITKKIQNLSQNILGEISVKKPIQFTPISTLKTNNIIDGRIALVAEAAHILPPTGAQGLNLSLRDVKILADTLEDTKSLGGDIGAKSTLSLYKKERESDIRLRTKSTALLNHFVKEDSHIHRAIRRGTFSILSNIEPLRNGIMKKGFQS